MRLLRILGLVLVHARAVRHIGRAKAAADLGAGGHHRLGRHVDAVGPHIGDIPRLIEALRRAHALLGAHAQLAAGLLLEGRGHEGGPGVAVGGLGFDRLYGKVTRLHRFHGNFGRLGSRNVEFLQFLAAEDRQRRLEFLPARGG